MLDETVPLQVLPRQPIRALGVPTRDPDEVVLHAECFGILRDPVRHDGRDRSQYELPEHHVVNDPLPIAEVVPGQDICEFLRPERFECPVVHGDPGERARNRLEQIRLHVGEAVLRRNRCRDPTGDEVHFLDVGVFGQRNRRWRVV